MNRLRFFAVLLSAAALAGCEKNAVQDLTGPLPSARIKFFNFGVGSPPVNFYANDTKMTAISSATGTESNLGVVYGNVASGGLYAGIEPGHYTISGRIASAAAKDVPISTVAVTIEDGKQYSYYQSGFYDAAAKTVDSFIVEDDFPAAIDWTTAHVRFVNAISNAAPMVLYATNDATGQVITIGGAVPYKSAGAFTAVPEGVYDLSTRYEGGATDVIVRSNVTFGNGRVYSIGARGDIKSTLAARRPFLDNTLNR